MQKAALVMGRPFCMLSERKIQRAAGKLTVENVCGPVRQTVLQRSVNFLDKKLKKAYQ